jgi:metal-dependent amidase/aminoacylase/carboxypeptidase family protein
LRERWSNDHTVRLHGIITSGGDVVNIIPDQICMEFLVRAGTIDKIKQLNAEFDRAITGAALAVGAGVKIETIPGYMPHYDDAGLEKLYDAVTSEIAPAEDNTHSSFKYGSTDMGELSCIMPTLHAYIPGSAGTFHGCDFHIARPELSYVVNAKVQAALLIELLADGAEKAKAAGARREGKLSIADYIKLTDSFSSTSILPTDSSIDAITREN